MHSKEVLRIQDPCRPFTSTNLLQTIVFYFFCFGLELNSLGSLNNFTSFTAKDSSIVLSTHLLLFPNTSIPPEHQSWLPKLARESRPQAPPSRISRVPLGLRAYLVPSISVLPLVSVLLKSKVLKPAYLSPREKRKFSALKMNWQLHVLILVSVGGRNMYVLHRLILYIIAKDIESLPRVLLQRNSLRWAAFASECP